MGSPSVDGFGQWMQGAITAAGLPLDCQPHRLEGRRDVGLLKRDAPPTDHVCAPDTKAGETSATRAMPTKLSLLPRRAQSGGPQRLQQGTAQAASRKFGKWQKRKGNQYDRASYHPADLLILL